MASRVVTDVLLFLAALVGGAVATVAHQSTVVLGTATVPWGIVVALLGVACFLVGVRLSFDHRSSTVAAALGVLLVVGVLSIESTGGSVLVPATPLGQSWIIGCVILAIVAIAIPRGLSRTSALDGASPGAEQVAPLP